MFLNGDVAVNGSIAWMLMSTVPMAEKVIVCIAVAIVVLLLVGYLTDSWRRPQGPPIYMRPFMTKSTRQRVDVRYRRHGWTASFPEDES